MIGFLTCLLRPVHEPLVKSPLGGWRCQTCGTPGASLDDMGHLGGGYVSPMRRLFKRESPSKWSIETKQRWES